MPLLPCRLTNPFCKEKLKILKWKLSSPLHPPTRAPKPCLKTREENLVLREAGPTLTHLEKDKISVQLTCTWEAEVVGSIRSKNRKTLRDFLLGSKRRRACNSVPRSQKPFSYL